MVRALGFEPKVPEGNRVTAGLVHQYQHSQNEKAEAVSRLGPRSSYVLAYLLDEGLHGRVDVGLVPLTYHDAPIAAAHRGSFGCRMFVSGHHGCFSMMA